VAERLVQTRGWNAWSYADVSLALGIRKASLHHHYSTKAELGEALVARYRQAFLASLHAIEAGSADPLRRLERYARLYGSVLRSRRMCLCGMLAADVATLPAGMRASVARFFAENEAWLTRVLEEGRRTGGLGFAGPAAATADFLIASLEGAMLLARGRGRAGVFDAAARRLLAGLAGGGAGERRARNGRPRAARRLGAAAALRRSRVAARDASPSSRARPVRRAVSPYATDT
jgi:TetR/AcrR family transcriptional regulator, transcriptional repressor for nem operon